MLQQKTLFHRSLSFYLTISVFFLNFSYAITQEVIQYSDPSELMPITEQAYFLIDSTERLDSASFRQIPISRLRHGKKIAKLGYTEHPLWVKFLVENHTNEPLFLYIERRLLHQIDCYALSQNGQWRPTKGGLQVLYQQGSFGWNTPIFPIGPRPKEILLKLGSVEAIGSTFHLSTAGPLLESESAFKFFAGATVWVPAFLGFFALIGFIIFKMKLFGLYALLQLSNVYMMLYNLMGTPILLSIATFVKPGVLTYLIFMLFALKFLELRTRSPKIYRLMLGLIILAIYSDAIHFTITILEVLGIHNNWLTGGLNLLVLNIKIEHIVWVVVNLVLLAIATRAMIRGYKVARFFILGFSLLMIGAWISLAAANGLLPMYPFIHAVSVGILTDSVFMVFALADRVNMIRKAREQAQANLLLQMQETNRQQQKVLSLRDEIARDMHDEIGSSLSTISLISANPNSDSLINVGDKFSQISKLTGSIITTLRDLIWSIDPENDCFNLVLYRIRESALEVLEPQNIQLLFQFREFPDNFVLPMQQRKDFYLIFKEAINNCAKYAEAKSVSIQIDYRAEHLELCIRDDGKGFLITRELAKQNGNGLKNMRSRATALAGDLQINSSPGVGTTIYLRFPVT